MTDRTFKSTSFLRRGIVKGYVKRGEYVRWRDDAFHVVTELPNNQDEWQSVEEFARSQADLDDLYGPVKKQTDTYDGWGIGAGFLVFAIGNLLMWHEVDRGLALIWAALCSAAIALKFDGKIAFAIIFFSVMALQSQPQVLLALPQIISTMFGMLGGTLLAGAVFGGPAGMIVGTSVGLARRSQLPHAFDFDLNEEQPIRRGIVYPAIWLAIAVTLYIAFAPKLLEWLEASA